MKPLRSPWWFAVLCLGAACTQPTAQMAAEASPSAGTSSPAAAPTPAAGQASTTAATTTMPTRPAERAIATFANGCFWCTEAVLEQLDGVLDVTSGYMGGAVDAPTYEQVCGGATGHAECVQVTFDPARIRYEDLLAWFFRSHDPTTLNRQGADVGTQYRSAIFVHDDVQRQAALQAIATFQPQFADPIVTEVSPASRFWPAEGYHQDYFRRNTQQGYCRMVIRPKLLKLGLDPAPKAAPPEGGTPK